jgi:hypothetical protein
VSGDHNQYQKPDCGDLERTTKDLKLWSIWAKALGSKAYDDDDRADKVAITRSLILLFEFIVGTVIILNAIANHGLGLIGLG